MSAENENDFKNSIIGLTERLINIISAGDYDTYVKWVDPEVTSFEPEAVGNMVSGLGFHKFWFDNMLSKNPFPIRETMISPVVHNLGPDCACIAYIRLTQTVDKNGKPVSKRAEETRIWQKRDEKWTMIHFHRSSIPSTV